MPIDARTRAVRTMAAVERQKVNKKLSRRVNQFENEACRALGIEQWPPTPALLVHSCATQAECQLARLVYITRGIRALCPRSVSMVVNSVTGLGLLHYPRSILDLDPYRVLAECPVHSHGARVLRKQSHL